MSTDTTTEAAIEAAARLAALIPQMIHERRMEKLWRDDYDRDRHIAMPLLRELGRVKPGDGWETAAGSIRIAIRRGEIDWQRAYEELRSTVSELLESGQWQDVINNIAGALLVPVPRRPDSAPYLDLHEAREEPDAITRARNAGALEALSQVIERLPATNTAIVDKLADEYGGLGEARS